MNVFRQDKILLIHQQLSRWQPPFFASSVSGAEIFSSSQYLDLSKRTSTFCVLEHRSCGNLKVFATRAIKTCLLHSALQLSLHFSTRSQRKTMFHVLRSRMSDRRTVNQTKETAVLNVQYLMPCSREKVHKERFVMNIYTAGIISNTARDVF